MATKTAPSPTLAGLVERSRLFALLDHTRAEAVERGRALGLLRRG